MVNTHLKENFVLFHFVIFAKGKSDFPNLFWFSSYGTIFTRHFFAKIAIFGYYMTHLRQNYGGSIKYTGDLSSRAYA